MTSTRLFEFAKHPVKHHKLQIFNDYTSNIKDNQNLKLTFYESQRIDEETDIITLLWKWYIWLVLSW